jgi:integrase
MSLYKHKNSPFWQMEFQYRSVTHRKSSERTNKEMARAVERHWIDGIKAEVELAGATIDKIDLDTAAGAYWADHGKDTINAQSLWNAMRHAVDYVGGNTLLVDLTTARFYELRQEYRKRPPRGTCSKVEGAISNQTVNWFIELLLRIMNHAEKIWQCRLPRRPKRSDILLPVIIRTRILSYEEEMRLEASCRPYLLVVNKFLLETGLRLTNGVELKWSEVDWEEEQVTVITKGKRRKEHVVPLSPDALAILKAQRGRHPTSVFTMPSSRAFWSQGRLIQPDDIVPLVANTFWIQMHKLFQKLGIEGYTIHDHRHTAATRLLRATGNIEIVRKFLGHTDIRTTLRYANLVQEDVRAAMLSRRLRDEEMRKKTRSRMAPPQGSDTRIVVEMRAGMRIMDAVNRRVRAELAGPKPRTLRIAKG